MKRTISSPRRRHSALEKVTEPSILSTYLCGYSLRTCTLFILWIDIILLITFFVMAILLSSLVHFYIITEHHKNETKYTFKLNKEKLLTLDLHRNISIQTVIEFGEIGKRILQIVLSSACVNFIGTLFGLVAVYNDKHQLLVPYLILLMVSVLWVSSFILLDVLFISCQYIKPLWLLLLGAIVYFLIKLHEVMVIYSYYHHYSGFETGQMKTPPYLTTESPMQLPVAPVPELKVNILKNAKTKKFTQN